MELVPIIYNSLLVVFTLLALVIGGSLICSKLEFCGEKKIEPRKSKSSIANSNLLNRTEPAVKREGLKKRDIAYRKSQPKIERKLIDNKKVKIVSRAEKRKKEYAQNIVSNKVARYSVVNTAPQERRARRDLFYKFSKMSIEYSQSA